METLKFVLLSFVQIILGVPLIVAGGGYLILILIFAIKMIFLEDPSTSMGLEVTSGLFLFLILPLASIAFCGFGFGLLKPMKENWISLKNNKGKFSFYSW